MRTTLRIDDDVLEAARTLARSENRTLGEVISDLARKGLQPRGEIEEEEGFPVFAVGPDARPMTDETVQRALEDES